MRPSLRIALTGVTAGALVCVLASCSGSGSDTAGDGTVTITVSGRPPATDAASLKTFDARVAEFEKANPKIKIKTNEYQYDQQSFQTKVGGGSLETIVRVPLTEMSGLIKRKQIADLTADFKRLKHSEDFNEVALGAAKGLDGKIYGIPTEEYALGLVYNRDLFKKAGLDPDQPPATWPEVRAAAKAISEKTDATGYAQMTKENTGGWMLTAMAYSFGDTMQEESGGKWANTFDHSDSGAEKSLKALKEMRWTDQSMGKNQLAQPHRHGEGLLRRKDRHDDRRAQHHRPLHPAVQGRPGDHRALRHPHGRQQQADPGRRHHRRDQPQGHPATA